MTVPWCLLLGSDVLDPMRSWPQYPGYLSDPCTCLLLDRSQSSPQPALYFGDCKGHIGVVISFGRSNHFSKANGHQTHRRLKGKCSWSWKKMTRGKGYIGQKTSKTINYKLYSGFPQNLYHKIQGVFKQILPQMKNHIFRNSIILKLNGVRKRHFRSNTCMKSTT